MNKTGDIRNIIFDLGGVLLDLDFNASSKAFQNLGASGNDLDYRRAIADTALLDFETGEISPDEFRQKIRERLGNHKLTDVEIDKAWCSMLVSVPPEKVTIVQNLAAKFRIFLFSNTNAIHIPFFKKSFQQQHGIPFESLFTKVFYSHEIHDRKPLVSSFEKVISLAGINPEETLFVDDLEVNVAAAQTAGLKVFHFTNSSDLDQIFE